MKHMLITLGLIASVAAISMLEGCKDPCKDVECLNSGTCNDDGECDCPANFYGETCETECINGTYTNGNCVCDEYYEGDVCDTEERIKFYGAFDVEEECPPITDAYATTIKAASGSALYKVEISKLYQEFSNPIIGDIDGSNLTIKSQEPETGFTISGSGTLSADQTTITLTYTVNDSSTGTVTCTATLTRQ